MSKKKPKLTRNQRLNGNRVLLVKPHNRSFQVDQRTETFILKAFQRGILEPAPIASQIPEIARNVMISKFLNDPSLKKKTHIFFLDADTCPDNEFAVEKLLSLNKPVVCGVTPIIRYVDEMTNCMWSVVGNEDDKPFHYGIDKLPKKPFKVWRTGGTTMLVRRDVLEKLEKPYQKHEYNEDNTISKLSEDMYFSDKIREAGFDIWCDPSVICHHYHYMDLLDVFGIYEASLKKNKAVD